MTFILTEKSTQAGYIKKLMQGVKTDKYNITTGFYEGIECIICPLQGHVFEQDKSSVNLTNFSAPTRILPRVPKTDGSYKKVHDRLKYIQQHYFRDIDAIILATDPDMEGCAIGKETIEHYRFDTCSDITYMDINNTSEKALRKALDAAFRTKKNHIDWEREAFASMLKADFSLTGLAVTHTMNAYSKEQKVNVFYTFGTQQIRALDLVVKRYREHEGFDRSKHYRIKAHTDKGIFVYQDDGDTKEEHRVRDIAATLEGKQISITKVDKKYVSIKSPKWMDGSQLGSKVSKDTGVSISEVFSNKTSVMQRMYESGLITYIRGEAKGKMPMIDFEVYADIARAIAPMYNAGNINPSLIKPYLWRKEDSKEKVNHTPCTLADIVAVNKYDGVERSVLDHAAKQILSTFYPDPKVLRYEIAGQSGGLSMLLKDEETAERGWQEIYDIKPKTLNNRRVGEIEESDSLEITKVEVEEYTKTPPPLFTETSLMDEIKKKGIGSESTFGEILNFILDRQTGSNKKKIIRKYCEVNKKKQIIPTKKGMAFVDAIPEELKNILTMFENGVLKLYLEKKINEDEALENKNKISNILYKKITGIFVENFQTLSAFGEAYRNYEKKETVNTGLSCPICLDGEIIEGEKVYQCSNRKVKKVGNKWKSEGCDFSVYKESKKGYIYTVTQETLEEMIDEGVAKVVIHSEKSGMEQTARLKFTDDYSKIEVITNI